MLQLPHFVVHASQVIRGSQPFLENGPPFVKVGNLIERAGFQPRLTGHGATVGFVHSAEDLQESCFSGAVGADEPDFFRWVDLEGDVSKYVLRTKRLRDAIK